MMASTIGIIFTALLATVLNQSCVESARILAIIPTPSYSHQVTFYPIWRELLLRGHQVTLITTDPLKDSNLTNLTEIDLHSMYKSIDQTRAKLNVHKQELGYFQLLDELTGMFVKLEREELMLPELQKLIKSDAKYDLVIVEVLLPAFLAFAHKFNCPMIGIKSLDARAAMHSALGNPTHPVLHPDFLLGFPENLNFPMRVFSMFHNLYEQYVEGPNTAKHDKVVSDIFGTGYPSTATLIRNLDILFVNTNPIMDTIRPMVPSIVQIGYGLHIQKNVELPKDLQDFLDQAPEGVIYFSLGSNINSQDLPKNELDTIKKVLSELPFKVLWKIDESFANDVSSNVKVMKWFPQQTVLRHKNIRAFITQGGLQSRDESISAGVPMIGIPFWADQFANMRKIENMKMGKSISRNPISHEEFKAAILEVSQNPIYRETTQKISQLIEDQPMTGLEKAIWWIEYVIRQNGAKHLRSPAMDLPSYQYYLLDVVGAFLAVSGILTYICFIVLKFVYCKIRSCNNHCSKKQKQKVN